MLGFELQVHLPVRWFTKLGVTPNHYPEAYLVFPYQWPRSHFLMVWSEDEPLPRLRSPLTWPMQLSLMRRRW